MLLWPGLILLIVNTLQADPPVAANPIQIPFQAEKQIRAPRFMEAPVIKIEGNRVEVSVTTSKPIPPGILYIGHFPLNQIYPESRFRFWSKEETKEATREHSFEFPLDETKTISLEHPTYDITKLRDSGGLVACRLSFYNPEDHDTVFYDFEFRYLKQGDKRILQAHLEEGPFLDQHRPDQAIISFKLSLPGSGYLKIGPEGHEGERVLPFKTEKPMQTIELAVPNLIMRRNYVYEVVLHSFVGQRRVLEFAYPKTKFRTFSTDIQDFDFAAMSDCRGSLGGGENDVQGVNVETTRRLLRSAHQAGASFVVFPGDLIDGYTTDETYLRQQFRSFKRASASVRRYIPIFTTVGNHESFVDQYMAPDVWRSKVGNKRSLMVPRENPSLEEIFAENFVNPWNETLSSEDGNTPPYDETAYAFILNGVGFIVANTNYWMATDPEISGGNLEGYVMDKQMAWIEKTMEAFDKKDAVRYIIMFAHEPAFPNSMHAADAMYWNGGRKEQNSGFDRTYVLQRRDRFWKAISSSPKTVMAVFGDEHNYSRTRIDADPDRGFKYPVWQIISGGVGAPYYDRRYDLPWSDKVVSFDPRQNYVMVKVREKSVSIRVHSLLNETIDFARLR